MMRRTSLLLCLLFIQSATCLVPNTQPIGNTQVNWPIWGQESSAVAEGNNGATDHGSSTNAHPALNTNFGAVPGLRGASNDAADPWSGFSTLQNSFVPSAQPKDVTNLTAESTEVPETPEQESSDLEGSTDKNTTDCEHCEKNPPCPPGPPGPPAPVIVVTKEVEVPVYVSESPQVQDQQDLGQNPSENNPQSEMNSPSSTEPSVGAQSGNGPNEETVVETNDTMPTPADQQGMTGEPGETESDESGLLMDGVQQEVDTSSQPAVGDMSTENNTAMGNNVEGASSSSETDQNTETTTDSASTVLDSTGLTGGINSAANGTDGAGALVLDEEGNIIEQELINGVGPAQTNDSAIIPGVNNDMSSPIIGNSSESAPGFDVFDEQVQGEANVTDIEQALLTGNESFPEQGAVDNITVDGTETEGQTGDEQPSSENNGVIDQNEGVSTGDSQISGVDVSVTPGGQASQEPMCYCPCTSPDAIRHDVVNSPNVQSEIGNQNWTPEAEQVKKMPRRNRKTLGLYGPKSA